MSQTLGDFIRTRRQDLGLTQEELAQRVSDHLRQSDISRLERNLITLPRRERLVHLAIALEVSLGELLVQSGWLVEGEDAVTAVAAIAPILLRGEDVPALEEPDLATLIADVALLQTTVIEIAQLLAHVDRNLTQLIKSPSSEFTSRSRVRLAAGVMDHWETTAIFLD